MWLHSPWVYFEEKCLPDELTSEGIFEMDTMTDSRTDESYLLGYLWTKTWAKSV